ncbi:MAG TPA: DEAD/DEAH box helicase [Actinocrinis sp.]|nr:DEAD/DEAH box helicase [Actinocrinis sp.]HZP49597.1 DEAD/DEAH box helicase [Actinocrinis sp.]
MAARRPIQPTAQSTARSIASTAAFAEAGLPEALTDLLSASGITVPFPIQAATLPDALAGRDVLGRGRTGSGKTLGFLLPVLTRLAAAPRKRRPSRPRAVILAPTRELATQIHDAAGPIAAALGLRASVVFGGVSARPQISALRSGLDLMIACPGRRGQGLPVLPRPRPLTRSRPLLVPEHVRGVAARGGLSEPATSAP